MNSRPRQSNSIMFCFLGGELYWYGDGGFLIVADDSLYISPRIEPPLLCFRQGKECEPCTTCTSIQSWPRLCYLKADWIPVTISVSLLPYLFWMVEYGWLGFPYEAANVDPIGMDLSARHALHLESVEIRTLGSVIRPKIRHPDLLAIVSYPTNRLRVLTLSSLQSRLGRALRDQKSLLTSVPSEV